MSSQVYKRLLDYPNYLNYLKVVKERHLKPKLLVLKDLDNNFQPKFVSPHNIFSVSEKDLQQFDILSYKLNVFDKINWYKDLSSDRVWPKDNYKKIKISYPDNSDIKYIWEIGRLQFLVLLGSLYKKTRNEKYAIKFKEIVTDFYKENPIKTGPNWKCTMDVAIRAVNLIYSYNYFMDSKSINKDFWKNYFNELYKTGQFIKNNLEWAPVRGNHYLADIVGLFYLGIVFKNNSAGKSWSEFSKKELEKEIFLQITEDGLDFEGSLSYHRLVTELFLYSFIFGKDNRIIFSSDYKDRLKKALNFVYFYTMNNGEAPQIGDNDNSQLLKLGNKRSINYHKYLLQLSDIYFKTKYNCSDIENETLFLTYIKKSKKYPVFPVIKSFSNIYNIYRDKDFYVLIKTSPKQKGSAGHNHNDQLSFILEYKKNYIFVDPGTYSYTGYPKERDKFRSTNSHNTVFMNQSEQNKFLDLFYIDLKNTSQTHRFEKIKDELIFEGNLRYLNQSAIHHRKIILNIKTKELTIIDNINSKNLSNNQAILNLNPDCKYKNNQIYLNNAKIKIDFPKNIKLFNSLYSERYGSISSNKKLVFDFKYDKLITKLKFT